MSTNLNLDLHSFIFYATPSNLGNIIFMLLFIFCRINKHANSAVCVYQLDIIDNIFKSEMSKFKGKGNNFYSGSKTVNSLWLTPEDDDIPNPRPGTVRISAYLIFIDFIPLDAKKGGNCK